MTRGLSLAILLLFLIGCGGGDGALENNNPGLNDVGVVAAFGDSITQGNRCDCTPYPARLQALIGKVVPNAGIHGTMACESIARTQTVIDANHPGFMLILYGVNDVIHGRSLGTIIGSLDQMISICEQNNVVPVLATYPVPIASHECFAGGTLAVNSSIRSLAGSRGIRCVDLEKEFSTGGTYSLADPSLMEADGLHPNDAGTQLMALAFADQF